jgi:hypothetical protein
MTRFILGALAGMLTALGLFYAGYASAASKAPVRAVSRAPTDTEMLAAWFGPSDKSQLLARACGRRNTRSRK